MSKESFEDMDGAFKDSLKNERDKLEQESRRKLASNRSIFTTDDYNAAWEQEQKRNEAAIEIYSKKLEPAIFKDYGGTREAAQKQLVEQNNQLQLEKQEQIRKSEEIQKQQTEKLHEMETVRQEEKDAKQKTERVEQDKEKAQHNNLAQEQKQKAALRRDQLREQFNRYNGKTRDRER